jgi:nitronate monooxygenase
VIAFCLKPGLAGFGLFLTETILVDHSTRATSRLGIRHPIVQGPFGGGLSTVELVSTVSNLGGLGSYGAHVPAPERIGALRAQIGRVTSQPFALNLWVSDNDPGARALSSAQLERVAQRFAPYFRELGLELPPPPSRYHESFDEQVEAQLEARPPVFSFVFGVPSAKFWRHAANATSSPSARPPPSPRRSASSRQAWS